MGNTKKTIVLILVLLSLTSLELLPSFTVKAQTRTLTVPDQYRTITDAINNAVNGDTIFVRAGTYEGPINTTLVINKSISIIGESAQSTIVNLYPAYNVTWIFATPQYSFTNALNITANSCVIANLTLNVKTGGFIVAQGNGIKIADNRILSGETTGVTLNGSNCSVTNNNMDGIIQVKGNYSQVASNNAYSIYVGDYWVNGTSFNIIKDNICHNMGLYCTTNNVVLKNNVSGGYGIELKWSDNNFLYLNNVSSEWANAVNLWLSSNNTFKLNSLTYGAVSNQLIELGGAYNNLFALNILVDYPSYSGSYVYDRYSDMNTHAYVLSYSNNIWSQNGLGNYWANYLKRYSNAFEVDNSGVGNVQYVINGNNTDAYPLMSGYSISTASIKLPDWTNLTLPTTTIQTPAFPSPQPSVSITPTTNPTTYPTQAPTNNPTSNPTTNPTTNQTVPPTQNPSSKPISTPIAPEFTILLIVPLLVFVFAVVVVVRHRKTANLKQ